MFRYTHNDGRTGQGIDPWSAIEKAIGTKYIDERDIVDVGRWHKFGDGPVLRETEISINGETKGWLEELNP